MAGESYLGALFPQEVGDLPVGNVAYLVVVVDDFSIGIADTAISSFHQSITCLVLCTHVAVDPIPAVVALACSAVAHLSVFTSGKRAAYCEYKISHRGLH